MKNPFRISLATGLLAAVALVGVGCSAQPDTTAYTTTTTSTTVPGSPPAVSIAVAPPAPVVPPPAVAVAPPPAPLTQQEVTRQTTTYSYPAEGYSAPMPANNPVGPVTVRHETVTTYPSAAENPAPMPPSVSAPATTESTTTTRYNAPGVVTSETVSNGPLGTTTTQSKSFSETTNY
jgi:hypothetical protein